MSQAPSAREQDFCSPPHSLLQRFKHLSPQCPASQPTSQVPVTRLQVLSGPVSSITADITGPSHLVTGVVWSSVQHHSGHHRSQSPGYTCPVSSITADITGSSNLVTGVAWSSVQHHSRHHRSQSPGYRCCLVQCPASQPTSQVPVTWLQALSGPVSSITADITGPSHLVTGVVW